MCGIAGILSTDPVKLTQERLQTMTDALAHRGPDGEGHWLDAGGGIGLGHRRLSIIDLTPAGAQPMAYLDRYTVIHNGELYNHVELREALRAKGYSFRSRTDTELIPAAYDLYGPGCLEYFDGMFAFALWDRREKTLFLARDRFGEKPLFYYRDGSQFLFASEMKALWAAGVPKEGNFSMFYNFIGIGYTQNPADPGETFFKGIRRLPARSFLRLHTPTGKLEIGAYWHPIRSGAAGRADERANADRPAADGPVSAREESAILEEFGAILAGSVRRRLRSDVAIGASLSGGLDSSAIVALVMEEPGRPEPFSSFSAVFPGFEKDESAFIKLVSGAFRLSNRQTAPRAGDFIRDFERLSGQQEEPFQSASVYAQYRVYALAAGQGIKVLLDGQGADELLAGYPKYFPWYWRELYRHDRKWLAPELGAALAGGAAAEAWTWQQRLAALLPGIAGAFVRRRRAAQQRANKDLSRDFVRETGISYYAIPPVSRLNEVLQYNTLTNGLEELLRYADRNSMAHGVEIRLPFLDHRLAEFLFALPARFKIRDGWTKWLLRTSAARLLPPEIVWRRDKVGYEPPQADWMADKTVEDYIRQAKRSLVEKGILDRAVLQKKIQPMGAHSAENFDWRYLVTAACLG